MRSSAPGAHDARQLAERRRRHEPALVVALLRPGIGEQDERPPDAGLGQPAQQRAGIVGVAAGYWRAARSLDGAQHLDDAVLERLAADQADVRIGAAPARARCSPPPKPISSHTSRDRRREQRPPSGAGSRLRQVERARAAAPPATAPPAARSARARAGGRSCASPPGVLVIRHGRSCTDGGAAAGLVDRTRLAVKRAATSGISPSLRLSSAYEIVIT